MTIQGQEQLITVVGSAESVPAPIRLCILSSSSHIGGLERLLVSLCRGLEAGQFDLTVCLLRAEGPFVDLMVSELGSRARVFDLASPFNLGALWALVKLLRQIRPHVIHAFGFKGDVLSRCLRPWLGHPRLASAVANPDLPYARWKQWLNRMTQGQVDVFWADCQRRAVLGVRRLGVPPSKIRVIYPGIQSDLNGAPDEGDRVRQELSIAQGAPVIALLGNLRVIKGHRTILDAAPLVFQRFPQAVIIFIGEDLTVGELAVLVEQNGLRDHVRFLGFRANPLPYLGAADVLVQPSLSEGLPRAILEAMALGKPVVASRVGGIPEVIEHGVNGYLVPPGNSQALARALIELLSQPERGRELGRRAREMVRQKFALDRMINEFAYLYRQLVEPASLPERSVCCCGAPATNGSVTDAEAQETIALDGAARST